MIYIVNLMLIFVWNIFCKPETDTGKKHFLFLVFVQLFSLATFRNYSVGYDSHNYYNIYISLSKMNLDTALRRSWIEPGYVLLNKLAYWIGGESYWVLWGLCTLLVLLPVFCFIYKYSDNVFYSVCIYICFGYYYASMNQIRQMISVSICLLGFMAFNEKKYIKTAIILIFAMSFHSSAMIFVVLLCVGLFVKYINRWLVLLSIVIATYIYFNFTQIFSFVMKYYGAFRVYITDTSKSGHLSTNFSLYTLVYLPVLFIAFMVNIKKPDMFKHNQALSLQLWAIILAEFILIISVKMHIMSRFALYFEIFSCTFLPSVYLPFAKGRYRQLLNVVFAGALLFINHYYLFLAENHGGKAGIVPYVLMKK